MKMTYDSHTDKWVYEHKQDVEPAMILNRALRDGSLPDHNVQRFGIPGETFIIPAIVIYQVCDQFDPVSGRGRYWGDYINGIDKDFEKMVDNYILNSGNFDKLLGKK